MKKRNPPSELASALRESDAKYRQVVERANDGIVIAQRGRLVFSNKSFAQMSGYPVEELDGIEFLKLVPPERRAEIADRVRRRLAGEDAPATYEIDLLRKDGTVFSVEVNAGVIEYQGEPGDLVILRGISERKRAEEALLKSEALFHSLIESLPQNVFSKDLEGRFTFANQHYCAVERKSPEDILGKTDFDLHPPELAAKYQSDDRQVVETGQILDVVEEHQPLGGDKSFVQVIKTPLYDTRGNVAGILGIFWDITERKQAEARLYHLNEVLRAVRNVNQLITHERDPQQLMSEACAILVQTRGYRMAWIGLIEAGHPRVIPAARAGQGADYLDRVTITWDESKTGQGPTGTAIRTRRPASCANVTTDPRFAPWREAALQRGFASVAAAPVMYGERLFGAVQVYADKPGTFDGEEISLLAELAGDLGFALQSIEDEAERKRAEEALRESESRYRELVQNANSVIIRWKCDGTILFFNEYAQEFFGYTSNEIIGKDVNILVPVIESTGGDLTWLVRDIVNHPEHYVNNINENICRDGRRVWMAWTNKPIYNKGQVTEILAIGSDITERKRAEAQLAEQLDELRRWHQATLGRETRILDLKREVNELLARAGQPPRYPSAESEKA